MQVLQHRAKVEGEGSFERWLPPPREGRRWPAGGLDTWDLCAFVCLLLPPMNLELFQSKKFFTKSGETVEYKPKRQQERN